MVNYCSKNPDKRPVDVIDNSLTKTNKSQTKWQAGQIIWDK